MQAEDLLTVYEARQDQRSPDPRGRRRAAKASSESRPQALAALLPQVSGLSMRAPRTTPTAPAPASSCSTARSCPPTRSGKGDATNKRWSIDLRQSVFSWANWVALKRADKTVAQAEADYQAEEQGLIPRVSTAYFNVLAAQDTVEAQSSALEAIARQLEQAEALCRPDRHHRRAGAKARATAPRPP